MRDEDVFGEGPSAFPRARRRFGQNFLTDATAVRRVGAALAPSASENVLEIGPGRGALTDLLLAAVPRITAIEIDRDLCALLRSRYPEDRLRLIEQDVLEVDLSGLAATQPLVIAGNLPYNISKPVAMVAGFRTLPEVSPLTAGSVMTSRTTVVGNSTEIALPS